MNRCVIALCGWLLAMMMQAQTAMQVLDKAAAEFKQSASVNISFEVGVNGEVDKGSILLQGNKFCTKLSNKTMWFDGKTMWTYVHDNEEVNISEPSASQVAKINPYSFLNMYKQGYDVAFGGNTSEYFEVVLTAVDAKASVKKMIVRVNKKTNAPTYVMMGSTKADMEISVLSYKKGTKQPDSAFKFDKKKYPKVDIVDLR